VPVIVSVRRRRLAAGGLAVVLAVAIVGAWVAHVHAITGRVVLVSDATARNLYYGNNPWTPLYRTWWFGSHKFPERGVPPAFARELQTINRLPPDERDATFVARVREHVRARPDLFLRRTLARARVFLVFDTSTGSFLHGSAEAGAAATLAALAGDAAHFVVIVMLAVALLLARGRDEDGWLAAHRDLVVLAPAIGLLYALPYWLSFSHPTYHVPVVAVLGVLAALRLTRGVAPARWPLVAFGVLLLLVQLEWALDLSGRR
jgi:hypothetical protein